MKKQLEEADVDSITTASSVQRPTGGIAQSQRWTAKKLAVLGLGTFIFLLLLLYISPAIVANSNLRHRILPTILAGYPGKMELDSVSLSWFAPVQMSGVRLYDLDGNTLLELSELRSEKDLLTLARSSADIGEIELVEPTIHLRMSGEKTNLEEVISAFVNTGGPSEKRNSTTLRVISGELIAIDENLPAQGKLKQLEGRAEIPADLQRDIGVQFEGIAEYDWENLTDVVDSYLNGELKLKGHHQTSFEISGLIPSAEKKLTSDLAGWNARTTLKWDRISAYGLNVQASEMSIDLNDSLIELTGQNIPVSDGKLSHIIHVDLDKTGDHILSSRKFKLMNVKLTPELTAKWISYASPVFAGTTSIDGEISADIKSLSLPLNAPEELRSNVQLDILASNFEAGPVAAEMVGLANRVYTLIRKPSAGEVIAPDQWDVDIPQQTMRIDVGDGDITHDQLKVKLNDLIFATSGTVSQSQVCDLILTARIPASWVEETEFLDGLAGTSMDFHIEGKITEPEFDDEELIALTKELATKVVVEEAADALDDAVLNLFGF